MSSRSAMAPPAANQEVRDRRDQLPRAFFRGVRAAVVVLTRVPAGGFPYAKAEWRWAAAHMPMVGALVGAFAAVTWAASRRAGDFVAAAAAVAASALATGALHEDGLADTADALGGGRSRERVLEILKDSRIGSFGACALVVSIVLRVALVARLAAAAPVALVVVGAASRLAPVALIVALPYVTDPRVAKSTSVATAGGAQLAVALVWTVAVAAGACGSGLASSVELAFALVAGVVATALAAAYFRARVGGITGDFLGAAQQAAECAMLFALAVARGGPA